MGENLRYYKRIVGEDVINKIYRKADKFSKKHIVCISSTHQGGGVAEMLNSTVFLLNELGIDFGWRILHGTEDFFKITKSFHNALQGGKINLSKKKKQIYYDTNRRFSVITHLNHDLVIVHDPQPLPLIDFYKRKQPWIFRFHIDISNPNPVLWDYLKGFIEKYDRLIVSKEDYKKDLKIPQSIIYPAIDPLTLKNKWISEKRINRFLSFHGIDSDEPFISQISRFDKWKDPTGVLKVFEKVRDKINCKLVLAGAFATDDPEGQEEFEKINKRVEKSKYKKDIELILNASDTGINCLQRGSSVVIQKSLREGFGLTVAEALYKETPVVASNIGGIPLQVIDSKTGYTHAPHDITGFSKSVIKLLSDDKLREKLGQQGKEHITKNFLITRLLSDWLDLFGKYI